MVLFNAIPIANYNFRQHKAKQNYGYHRKNLKCSPENSIDRNCCYSGSFNVVDKVMEIERYYNAFPALGTAPSNYPEDVSFPGSPSGKQVHHKHVQAGEHVQAGGVQRKPHPPQCPKSRHDTGGKHGGDSQKWKHYSPRSPNTKVRHFNSRKDGDYGNNFKKSYKPHSNKSRKQNNEAYKHQQGNHSHMTVKRVLLRESKPWKILKEVEHEDLGGASSEPSTTTNEVTKLPDTNGEEFISEEVLDYVLNNPSTDLDTTNSIRSLWQQDNTDDLDGDLLTSLWQFNIADTNSAGPPLPEQEESSRHKAVSSDDGGHLESSDYEMIEQSLASIKFCENVPDGCKDSKLMHLFREDPLTYMLQQSDFTSMEQDECTPPQSFTCRHCQESYEIVLDCESFSLKKNHSSDGILGLVDSRLDFDWSKYHPPPWLSTYIGGDEPVDVEDGKEVSKSSCDCGFCRHKIWKRTCRWCATPLK